MESIKKHSFSFILVVLFLLFFAFSIIYLQGIYKNIEFEQQADIKVNTNLKYDIFVKELNEIKQDVFFLSDLYKNINEIADTNNNPNLFNFKVALESFTNRHPLYAQIRFLDLKGKELIRVNNQNGKIYFVPQNSLQDKSNRYYFKDALELKENQLYLSKFDLNMENGKIDLPFNPTLRVVMPIFKDGVKVAFVIINYSGEKLLEKIKQVDNRKIKTVLLNKDSFYLIADQKHKEWSFMFDGKINLKAENRFLWNHIENKSTSIYKDNDHIYYFKEIYPLELLNNKHGLQKWIIVSSLEQNVIYEEFQEYLYTVFYIFIFFIIVIILFSYVISLYINKINKYEKEVQLASKRMDEMKKINTLDELIDNIAHQWRQPLAAIRMCANNIEANITLNIPMDTKELQEYVQDIDAQTQYLSETIDSLHDKFFIAHEDFVTISVEELIGVVLERFEDQFTQNNIIIIKDIEDVKIQGQKYQLIEALYNIVQNAQESLLNNCKEENRYIYISSKLESQSLVNLTITDSGGGIDSQIIDNIFEPYFTTKHKALGTGISLYVTYQVIVMNHNGDIVVKNIETDFEGKKLFGVSFSIALPLLPKK